MRSPRGRRRVSFASSPIDDLQLSFRQTSTPLTSTPAPLTASPALKPRSYFVDPLHIYVWSAIERVWEITKTVIHIVTEQTHSAFNWACTKVVGDGVQNVQRRRSRGRPPKVAAIQESQPLLTSLKSNLNDGAAWTVNKLESAGETLAFLVYTTITHITSTVTYIQNNYASA